MRHSGRNSVTSSSRYGRGRQYLHITFLPSTILIFFVKMKITKAHVRRLLIIAPDPSIFYTTQNCQYYETHHIINLVYDTGEKLNQTICESKKNLSLTFSSTHIELFWAVGLFCITQRIVFACSSNRNLKIKISARPTIMTTRVIFGAMVALIWVLLSENIHTHRDSTTVWFNGFASHRLRRNNKLHSLLASGRRFLLLVLSTLSGGGRFGHPSCQQLRPTQDAETATGLSERRAFVLGHPVLGHSERHENAATGDHLWRLPRDWWGRLFFSDQYLN